MGRCPVCGGRRGHDVIIGGAFVRGVIVGGRLEWVDCTTCRGTGRRLAPPDHCMVLDFTQDRGVAR